MSALALRRIPPLTLLALVAALLMAAAPAAAKFTAGQAAWLAEGVFIQQAHKSGVSLTRGETSADCTRAARQVQTFKCATKAPRRHCTGTMQVYVAPMVGYKVRGVRVRCK